MKMATLLYRNKIHPRNRSIWENGIKWIHCWIDFLLLDENSALDVGTPVVVLSIDTFGNWDAQKLSNQLWWMQEEVAIQKSHGKC